MRFARTDLLSGAVLLVVAAVFWVQREEPRAVTGAFPDFVLLVLAVLAVAVLVRGLWRPPPPKDAPNATLGASNVPKVALGTSNVPKSALASATVDRRFLAAALVVLPVWALAMGLIGFTISSVVAFVLLAQLIRRERPRPLPVARDTVVGIVLVVAAFFVFTEVLLVPLPVSVLIGM